MIYGDYTVSGSTLSLDYAANLYASTATTPKTMLGSGWSTLQVNSTKMIPNALTQLRHRDLGRRALQCGRIFIEQLRQLRQSGEYGGAGLGNAI